MIRNIFAMSMFFIFNMCGCMDALQLKKVVIYSRHNIRAPLYKDLGRLTPKKWPDWGVEPGYLTPRGATLERYMGEYFSNWLRETGLLTKNRCPENESVDFFANSLQRTIKTAEAFSEAAFPNCNFTVNFNTSSYPDFDSPFRYAYTNHTEAFKLETERVMREKLDKIDLMDVYAKLNVIADLKNSDVCKDDKICDLTKDTDIIITDGPLPDIGGRFRIGNALVDAFLVSYFEGFPLKDVAWGHIKSEENLESLSKILEADQNVRFNLTKYIMKRTTKALLEYLKDVLNDDRKFTFISGHETNIRSLMVQLGIESSVLPEQVETTPIGGKLVFQKFSDGHQDFLKIDFVYLSMKQIREARNVSSEFRPKNKTLVLKTCSQDANGMCAWDEFENVLNDLVL